MTGKIEPSCVTCCNCSAQEFTAWYNTVDADEDDSTEDEGDDGNSADVSIEQGPPVLSDQLSWEDLGKLKQLSGTHRAVAVRWFCCLSRQGSLFLCFLQGCTRSR